MRKINLAKYCLERQNLPASLIEQLTRITAQEIRDRESKKVFAPTPQEESYHSRQLREKVSEYLQA